MSDITKFKPKYDVTYEFTIKRIAEGSFKNLWELRVKAPGDKVYLEEIDADSLQMAIDRIGFIFEQDGF